MPRSKPLMRPTFCRLNFYVAWHAEALPKLHQIDVHIILAICQAAKPHFIPFCRTTQCGRTSRLTLLVELALEKGECNSTRVNDGTQVVGFHNKRRIREPKLKVWPIRLPQPKKVFCYTYVHCFISKRFIVINNIVWKKFIVINT